MSTWSIERYSLGIRRQTPKKRSAFWVYDETRVLVKRAWRMGFKGLAAALAVGWDTQFSPVDIRSVTKSFVVTEVLQLVAQGRVGLDDPIAKYYRGVPDGDRITLRDLAGMTARGYARDFAERCFKQIEGFGSYGFPESHAASFAHLVYVSAWTKKHHPAAFARNRDGAVGCTQVNPNDLSHCLASLPD